MEIDRNIDNNEFSDENCCFIRIINDDESGDGSTTTRKSQLSRESGRLSVRRSHVQASVQTRKGGVLHEHRYHMANNDHLANIIGFYLRYSIYAQVNFNFNIDLKCNEFKPVKGSNGTLFMTENNYGTLFIKCFNDFNDMTHIGSCLHKDYKILPRLFGIHKLSHSKHGFKYGLIMDGLYTPKVTSHRILEMISNLKELHADNVIHGDVRADNIMMDSCGSLKLIDPINIILGKIVMYQPDIYTELTTSCEFKVLLKTLVEMFCVTNGKEVSDLKVYADPINGIEFNFIKGFSFVDKHDGVLRALALNDFVVLEKCEHFLPDKTKYDESSSEDESINDDIE